MSLSIRQWLIEHNIKITQLQTPAATTAGIAFRIAQDMEVKSLTPFDVSPLAELLELPLAILWESIDPVFDLSIELLRIFSRKKPLKRNEGTWLAFQVAYVKALQKILEEEFILKRPWIGRAHVPAAVTMDETKPVILLDPQLQGILKTLRPGRLSDTQAEQALSSIGESFLVGQMNNLAIAWFITNGLEEMAAKIVVQRLVNALPGYLLAIIAENPLPLVQLQRFVRLGNLSNNPLANQILTDDETISLEADNEFSTLSAATSGPNLIDLEREKYRATLVQSLSEPILGELYSLWDLFVPLKAVLVEEQEQTGVKQEWDRNSSFPSSVSQPLTLAYSGPPVDLMEWATNQLSEPETIAIIEGEAGQGKTSFCQMWAAKVAQEIYPSWMPVFIRLRDVTLGKNLEETLDSALKGANFTRADGWLELLHPPCLLILDGLDELPRFPGIERQVSAFLDRVLQFQSQYASTSGRPRHKIVLTCRSQTLNNLAHSLSVSCRRVAIQPFDQEQLKQWFKLWARLQPKSIAQAYFNFLKQNGVFRQLPELKDLAELVHKPFSLLVLGLLYRGGRLDESIFVQRGSQLRFEIYDRLSRWLLGETPDAMSGAGNRILMPVREISANTYRTPEAIASLLQGRTTELVHQQMQAAALILLHTNRCWVSTEIIAGRLLTEDAQASIESILPGFYFHLFARREKEKETAIFAHSFSLTSSSAISFSYPKLGEFLCAEALAKELKSLTRRVADAYGETIFAIDSPAAVAQYIYNLLGFGVLSPEIEELTIERLRREEARDRTAFSFAVLAERLYSFYRIYCRGRWLDEGFANSVRAYLQSLGNPLNIIQIDAAIGLNIFLLLCACYREAKIPFLPCGDPDNIEDFNSDRLLSLIGRTTVLSPNIFWQRSQYSLMMLDLSKAYLQRVVLPGANFWKTNFFRADLAGANLAGANFLEANLSWANLTGANLAGANLSAAKLEGANLTGANLLGANLQLASLTNVCLFGASMDDETRDWAEKNGALFSLKQYKVCQQAIATLDAGTRHSTPAMMANRSKEPQQADATILLIERENAGVSDYDNEDANRNNDETMFL